MYKPGLFHVKENSMKRAEKAAAHKAAYVESQLCGIGLDVPVCQQAELLLAREGAIVVRYKADYGNRASIELSATVRRQDIEGSVSGYIEEYCRRRGLSRPRILGIGLLRCGILWL